MNHDKKDMSKFSKKIKVNIIYLSINHDQKSNTFPKENKHKKYHPNYIMNH